RVHRSPVPAQAMHSSAPRLSRPGLLSIGSMLLLLLALLPVERQAAMPDYSRGRRFFCTMLAECSAGWVGAPGVHRRLMYRVIASGAVGETYGRSTSAPRRAEPVRPRLPGPGGPGPDGG